jgi:hypothetical protein
MIDGSVFCEIVKFKLRSREDAIANKPTTNKTAKPQTHNDRYTHSPAD